MEKKLCKSATDKKIDGVCAGIAKYFGIDVTLVRVVWLLVILFGGTGLLAYIVCAIVLPREQINPGGYTNENRDEGGRSN